MRDHGRIAVVDFPEDCLPTIVKWRNDASVNRYLRPGYRTPEQVRQWYREHFSMPENRLFAIRAGEELVGYCTLEGIDRDNNKCEIGVVIGEKAHWRKGVGGTVIRELLRRAFTDLRVHRVEAVVQADNVASARCFSSAGFQLDGRLRDARRRDGKYIDLLVFSILDTEA